MRLRKIKRPLPNHPETVRSGTAVCGTMAPMKKRWLIFPLLLLWLLAACDNAEVAQPSQSGALLTAVPTPTLAAGLPTVPAPAPTLAPLVGAGSEPITQTTEAETLVVPTLTAFPTPTNTPLPVERIELAAVGMKNGNYGAVIQQLSISVQQPDLFTVEEQAQNLYTLGLAYLRDGRAAEAAQTFEQLAVQFPDQLPSATYFHLGQAYNALGNYAGAVESYQTYLAANSDMGAYVYPLIAKAYLAAGDTASAQIAHETAVTTSAHYLTDIANRRLLAQQYLDNGNIPGAIAQYDAIRGLAFTEFTQGEMNYLAGSAELLSGNNEAAYGRFQESLSAYPRAYETYLGLVALVEAGVPVADYQRGLVNFHADSFEAASAAFARYIQANPETYNPEAHLYAAWSYEGLGDLTSALAELENYALSNAAGATIERGRMLARAGDLEGAQQNYNFYLENYPEGEAAPFAAWWLAVIAEQQGDVPTAVSRYTFLAENYPWHEDTPEALFEAGLLAYGAADVATAVDLWDRAARTYPDNLFGGAALLWLLRILPSYVPAEGVAQDPAQLLASAQQLAAANTSLNYYSLRANDFVNGVEPYTGLAPFMLPTEEVTAVKQTEAEAWLRSWLGLEPGVDVRSLSPQLATDPRLIRGEKLWQLGLLTEAKQELEAVRETAVDDVLLSYQLALYFRDLGLYRSSILAAARIPWLTGQSIFEIPKFIGQLIYPVYYDDLVLPLADKYDYDPRLHFALLRQESLFESFATSSAVAQGLSQVIPDTGAYIAQRLNWPEYENEDLYKPYVGLNFGAYYLNQQLDAFNGDEHAALSAYNAGPGNAARWYEVAGSDLDQYLETVNFDETRLYIQRIYEGFHLYNYLYGSD